MSAVEQLTCPSWCVQHWSDPDAPGIAHHKAITEVWGASGGSFTRPGSFVVQVEQVDVEGDHPRRVVCVRLPGGGDLTVSATDARLLAAALTDAAERIS